LKSTREEVVSAYEAKQVNCIQMNQTLTEVNRKLEKRHADLLLAGYGACALAGCLWGLGFFFGKIVLREMSVPHMVLYRFWFACPPLFFVLRRPRFSMREWRLLLIAAFLGIPVQYLVQFQGLAWTTVSHAALMVGTMPVILAIGACIFAHERLDLIGWFALTASSAGVTLIVLGSNNRAGNAAQGPTLAGDLLVVLSLLIALAWVLLNKFLMRTHSPLQVTAFVLLSGTLMLTIWVVLRNGLPPVHNVSSRAWMALLGSGLLCNTSAMFLWNWGIARVPASRAGVFLNIEPALGSVLGVELLGEKLSPYAWIGGGMILAAAFMITSLGRREVS
jgi:drug/metabolite transporter (DMT)-like permease